MHLCFAVSALNGNIRLAWAVGVNLFTNNSVWKTRRVLRSGWGSLHEHQIWCGTQTVWTSERGKRPCTFKVGCVVGGSGRLHVPGTSAKSEKRRATRESLARGCSHGPARRVLALSAEGQAGCGRLNSELLLCRHSRSQLSATEAELQIAALGSKPHSCTCQRMVRARCSPKGAEQQNPCEGRAPAELQAAARAPGRAAAAPSRPREGGAEAPGEAHQDNQGLSGTWWRATTYPTQHQLCWCPLTSRKKVWAVPNIPCSHCCQTSSEVHCWQPYL